MKKGDYVKSNFRAKWKGVILDIKKGTKSKGRFAKKSADIASCLVVRHADGRTPEDRVVMEISTHWLAPIEKFETNLPEGWFRFK